MRQTRLLAIVALAVAALPAGALTQEQQIEVVQTIGGGGSTVVMGGGSMPLAPIQQTGTGMLVGRVVDASTGSPVAGALVAIGGAMQGVVRGGGPGGRGRAMTMVMAGNQPAQPAGGPGARDADQVPRVLTDSTGRFAFRNLPAGSFNISAEKSGYLDGAYGRLRPGGASQQVEVKDGEHLTDVSVRLFRAAAITGRLVDGRGEPVVGASVRAYRRELQSGRRVLDTNGIGATTDDRGVYRISNLTPGEYVVAAPTVVQTVPSQFQLDGGLSGDLLSTLMSPGNSSLSLSLGGGAPIGNGQFVISGGSRDSGSVAPEMDGRLLTYPTAYHPTASTVEEAAVITVGSGEERSGVDIAVPLVPTTTISGRLMGPDGPASGYGLHLVPSNTGGVSSDPGVATAITGADGSFMFAGVPAGNYVIQTVRAPRGAGIPRIGTFDVAAGGGGRGQAVVAFSAREVTAGPGRGNIARVDPEDPPPTLWVAMPVSIDATPVNGVALTLREGFSISGQLAFDGAAERPTPEEMTRIAVIAEAVDGNRLTATATGRVTDDGRFETTGLLPGRYVLRAVNAGPDWTMRSASLGGVDVSDAPLTLERNTAGVTVTFTDRPSSLTGLVRDGSGAPDSAAAVIVFPADNRRWVDYGVNPRRMRLARTTSTGSYTFSAMPAGDYYVVAIAEEYSGEWQDPRVLEQVAPHASRVTLAEGSPQTQDLSTQPFRGATGGAPAPIASAPALHAASHPVRAPSATVVRAELPGASITPDANAWAEEPAGHGPFVPDVEPSAGAPQQQARDARVTTARGTATVSGRVLLDDGSNQPLRRARVSLRNAETRLDYAVMTGDDGRFQLTGVPAGRYSLSATKPAHITAYYGSRRAGRGPGAPVAVTDGATIDGLELRMPRGAVIAGRVYDEFGQPMANVGVRVMSPDGGRAGVTLALAGIRSSTQTDDRGMYRIYGLMPGEYVVVVTPPRTGAGEVRQLTASDVDTVLSDMQGPQANERAPFGGRAVGYAPVYYPGTTSASTARRVTVAGGQVLESIDMPVSLVPTARIEGTIVGPTGAPVTNASALLLPETNDAPFTLGAQSIVRTDQEGRFTAINVVPGRYRLSARSGGGNATQVVQIGGGGVFVARSEWRREEGAAPAAAPADPPTPLWAEAVVDVNGQDISGLVLTMQEGMSITGRVAFDGTMAPPEDLSRVRVSLMQAAGSGISLGTPSSRINPDGTFTLDGITPGSYRVVATAPNEGFSPDSGWVARSAMAGGRDVLDVPLDVMAGQPPSELVVTFTDRRSELSGTVLDPNGAPVSDLTILVFPTDPAMWAPNARRMPRPQQPGSDGQFRFTALPPGEYFLAAVTEIEDSDWGDPGFMEQVAAAGIRLTVVEGEKTVQDLRLGGG